MFGKFPSPRGLTPEYFLKLSREHTKEANRPEPAEKKSLIPWPSSKDTSATDASATDTSATDTDAKDASVTDASAGKPSVEREVARS